MTVRSRHTIDQKTIKHIIPELLQKSRNVLMWPYYRMDVYIANNQCRFTFLKEILSKEFY